MVDLTTRLRARKGEITQALFDRAIALPDTPAITDPEYREGFRSAVSAAFEYSLAMIESGADGDPPPVPVEILTQARLAARHSVGLDAVLRRYVAGSACLDEFMLDECAGRSVQNLLRLRAAGLEHLLSRISVEYEAERRIRARSRETRMFDYVANLLRGEPLDPELLSYEMNLNHVGLVARGPGSKELLREIAKTLDSRLLLIRPDAETTWAWLGRYGDIHGDQVQAAISMKGVRRIAVAIGEPAPAIAGWRHTHHQAKAAFPVAARSATRLARYADVCLVASALQDNLLRVSLKELYVEPLLNSRDGGVTYMETLRAYFASHRNGEATAAVLNLSRQAIAGRLRVIEDRLGRPLHSCAAHIEAALQLEELGA